MEDKGQDPPGSVRLRGKDIGERGSVDSFNIAETVGALGGNVAYVICAVVVQPRFRLSAYKSLAVRCTTSTSSRLATSAPSCASRGPAGGRSGSAGKKDGQK